ncbi:MAG: family 10 glycosylhydrolase, partial [Clostridia bacterium]|nr:family 10 glycosylhydrolase [Clostridia bacterium]
MIKKLVYIILLIVGCLMLAACGLHSDEDNPTLDIHEDAAFDGKLDDTTKAMNDEDSFIFTWLTYSELQVKENTKKQQDYEKYIESLFENMKKIFVTDCFVQVRPFADSVYPSKYYPLSVYAEKAEGFDVLESIITVAEKYDIDIHAWINPYRISYAQLSDGSVWLEDYKNHIMTLSSGTYFIPSSLKAQSLILSGVSELMAKYNIKGIHIDDYFYPEDITDEDEKDYGRYKKDGGKKEISAWRRENVNSLVSAIYSKVKSFGEDKVFSVSPAGNIDKNYNQLNADVYSWCKGGYCDIILPQIYFGFDNQTLPFDSCLDRWL